MCVSTVKEKRFVYHCEGREEEEDEEEKKEVKENHDKEATQADNLE